MTAAARFPAARRPRALGCAAAVLAAGLAFAAHADEAAIRKALAERLPDFPKIDEVSKTPIAGLWEIRVGTEILYTDETGSYLVEGQLIDTKTRANLTEARVAKLTAIDFKALPLKDAIVWKNGSGARKLVIFADPNCGYCKKFERDLQAIRDVTVYTFLYPILGSDSSAKSRSIWCAKDRTASWRDWMIKGTPVADPPANCDVGALARNLALGRKHKITGTPALVFEDGTKRPGALEPEMVEKQFLASGAK